LLTAVKMDKPYLVGDERAELMVSTSTAAWAIRNKLAEGIGGSMEVGPTRAELEAQEAARLAADPSTQALAFAEDREADEVAAEDDRELRPKRPYGNAPKSAWAQYAVDMGGIDGCPDITIERAEEMTKADLMSRYGARLGEED
jgi:hypothetical protein